MKANHNRLRLKRLARTHTPCFSTTIRGNVTDKDLVGYSRSCTLKMKPTAKVGRGWYEYTYRDETSAPVSVMVHRRAAFKKVRAQTERDRLVHALMCIRTVVKIRRKNREAAAAKAK